MVIDALFCHPRELAMEVFNQATIGCQEQIKALEVEGLELHQQYHQIQSQLENSTETWEEGNGFSQEKEDLLQHLNYYAQMIEQNQLTAQQWSTTIFSQDETTMVIQEIL